jgi:hypothetical protein
MNIICRIFGHRYRLLRKVTHSIREIECKRCKAQFGMSDEHRAILPLDSELRRAHSVILGEAHWKDRPIYVCPISETPVTITGSDRFSVTVESGESVTIEKSEGKWRVKE